MDETTNMVSLRLTTEEVAALAEIVEADRTAAPPELARVVGKTSVVRRLIAEEHSRLVARRDAA